MLKKLKICNSTFDVYGCMQSKLNERLVENNEVTLKDEVVVLLEAEQEAEDFNRARNLAFASLCFGSFMLLLGVFLMLRL